MLWFYKLSHPFLLFLKELYFYLSNKDRVYSNSGSHKSFAPVPQRPQLTNIVKNTAHIKDKLAQYERMEGTLKSAIVMAQRTSDQIKSSAHRESEIILEDAKRNASRIINESLLKAEKADMEAEMLKRNVNIFKRKLRGIIEAQLEMVEDIEKVEM